MYKGPYTVFLATAEIITKNLKHPPAVDVNAHRREKPALHQYGSMLTGCML